jgi:hypothetical protein
VKGRESSTSQRRSCGMGWQDWQDWCCSDKNQPEEFATNHPLLQFDDNGSE